MEGKRKILELDISTEKILTKASELKKELDRLKEEKKQLKKATGDNSEALAKNEAKIKAVSGKYRTAQKSLTGLVGENNKYLSVKERLDASLNEEVNTINKARQSNKDLLAVRNELNLATEAGRQEADKINQKMDQNNAFIKENTSAYEKQKINIGNYKESVNQALKENGLFGDKLQGVQQAFSSLTPFLTSAQGEVSKVKDEFKDAGKSTEGATKAQNIYNKVNKRTIVSLKALRLAIVATGIGAFVVALGSLVTFLSTTQAGIDKVNRVLVPLKEILKGVLGVTQELGQKLFDAFSKPKESFESFIDTVKSGYNFYVNNVIDPLLAKTENFVLGFRKRIKEARIAWNEFTGDDAEAEKLRGEFEAINKTIEENQKTIQEGADNIKKTYKDTGKAITGFFDKAIDRGNKIQKLQEEIERGQNDLIKNEAQLEFQIKEQKKVANDVSKSLEERTAAAEKGLKLSKKLTQEQNDLIDKQLKQLRLKNEANDTSRADLKKIAELEAKRFKKQKRVTEFEKNLESKLNSIRKEEERNRKKAQKEEAERQQQIIDQKISDQEKELELFIAKQGTKAKTLKEEVEIARQVSEKKRQILLKQFESGIIGEKEYQIEVLKIQQEYADKQSALAVQNAKDELAKRKESINREAETIREKNILIREAEKEHQNKLLKQGKIDKREFETAMDKIEAEFREKENEREAERRKINKENQIANEQLNFFEKKKRERERLKELEKQEILNAEKVGADVTAIEKKYSNKRKAIDEEVTNNKIQMTSQALGAVKGFFKEESIVAKAMGIAQATMDTYIAANKALAAYPPPFSFILAGATIGKGLMNVAKISGVGLAKGGALDDPNLPGDETSDSVPARLSKGESVINAKSTKKYKPLLSKINQEGGGVPFARGGMPDSSRRSVRQQTSDNIIDYDQLAKSVAKGMPQQSVAVTEIRDKSRKRTRVEERANHG